MSKALDASGVETLDRHKIVGGFPNGTFQPPGPTTRARAAGVLAIILQKQA